MESDGELVTRCLHGDMAAFGSLVERHRHAIVSFCRHYIGDFHEAQDLAQDTFVRAYFSLHSLRQADKFGPWLRAIALRRCQSWHRRRIKRPLPWDEPAACALPSVNEDLFGQVSTRLLVEEALGALPQTQRETLTLRYREGLSVSEIAGRLHVPVETIRTRLRRAKRRFQEVFIAMSEEAQKGFTRRVLDKVELVQMESGLTWPLYACLHSLGKDWSLAYLTGIVGTAFRLTVDERISDNGPTNVLDWDQWFARITRLGYDVEIFNAQLRSFSPSIPTQTEEEFKAVQAAAWDAARASLDRGVPVIAWMPMTQEQKAKGLQCEYGLLVGYDTEAGVYQVRLPWTSVYAVPWDGFGRADPVNWFNVIVFGEERPVDERALESEALVYAVEHAHSPEPGHGLSGYTTWLKALETGRIQPDGSPKTARLLREARELAAAFLREIDERLPAAGADLRGASQHYKQVADAWEEYRQVFSPAVSDAACDPAKRAAGLEAVGRAYAAEQAAVRALENALARKTAG